MQFHWIYFATNASMPGLLKIGFTRRSPADRLTELDTTGVPQPFEVAYVACVNHAQTLESNLHLRLSHARVRGGREFFAVELEKARAALVEICEELSITIHFEKMRDNILIEKRDDSFIEFNEEKIFVIDRDFFEALAFLDLPKILQALPNFILYFDHEINSQNLKNLYKYYTIPLEERTYIIPHLTPVIRASLKYRQHNHRLGLFAGDIYKIFGFRELGQIICEEVVTRSKNEDNASMFLLGAGAMAYFCGDKEYGSRMIREYARSSVRYFPAGQKFYQSIWHYIAGFWAIIMRAAEGENISSGEFDLLRTLADDKLVVKLYPSIAQAIQSLAPSELASKASAFGTYSFGVNFENWETDQFFSPQVIPLE